MIKNIGVLDRIIRFVAFDFLIGVSYLDKEETFFLASYAFVLSIYLLFTLLIAYSPIYHLVGYSTRQKSPA